MKTGSVLAERRRRRLPIFKHGPEPVVGEIYAYEPCGRPSFRLIPAPPGLLASMGARDSYGRGEQEGNWVLGTPAAGGSWYLTNPVLKKSICLYIYTLIEAAREATLMSAHGDFTV